MKYLLITVLLFSGMKSFASGNLNLPIEKVNKYERNPELSIQIPTDFAKEFLLTPELLQKIKGHKIHHIDLVYTAYKKSNSFNQVDLNKRRIAQLKKKLPQILSDKPSWKLIEQQGATNAEDAHDYFHGFVIHFSDEIAFRELNDFFSSFQNSFMLRKIDNASGADLEFKSGTKIHIPQNAVSYSNGKAVIGEYTLAYKEFRDPADIAFSGIPMTYNAGGKEYNFNSSGMYEIRANQNNQELVLKKAITVDFNCTNQAEGVDFYQMDDANGNWKKLRKIDFDNDADKLKSDVKSIEKRVVEVAPEVQGDAIFIHNNNFDNRLENLWQWETKIINNQVSVSFNKPAWEAISESLDEDINWSDKILSINKAKKELRVSRKDSTDFSEYISNCHLSDIGIMWNNNQGKNLQLKPVPNSINATLLAENADAGHTYPTMVRGLNSSKFGVYNCDQVYRVGNPVNLSPQFVDASTGREINNKHVACVIDLGCNGAFSFHPNSILCDKKGKNVILLFTNDKKVYMINEKEFSESVAQNDNSPEFKMIDMTEKLKTSDDLKKLLNL